MPSIYVPILKSKSGELAALKALTFAERTSIQPLIEVTPLSKPKEREDGTWTTPRTLISRMKSHALAISEACPTTEQPIFLDTHFLAEQEQDAMSALLSTFFSHGSEVRVIPVVRPNLATIQFCKSSKHGACFRVPNAYLYKRDLQKHIASFLKQSELNPGQIDLLIDCGFIGEEEGRAEELVAALRGGIQILPHLSEWRSVAIAGGSFPSTISKLTQRKNTLSRREWQMWSQLTEVELPRTLLYSDYGIQNPALPPQGGIAGYANIRYTSKGNWIVMKGALLRPRDPQSKKVGEYKALVLDLAKATEFRGGDFSAGDHYIAACVDYETPSHENKKWRQVGTSHHITTVLEQASTSFAPEETA